MQISEMSNTFDILYNNVTSNQAPGLNEAEKSVFLTKAQNMLVKEYFNTKTDGFGGGFDGSQQRQYDFSSLIRVESLFDVNSFKKDRIEDSEKLDRRSRVYLFPLNYFLAVNEILSDVKQQYSVLPLSYAEYQRLMLKPYNFPVKRGAWRLLTDKKNCNYWKEFVKTTNEYNKEVDSPIDYIFQSSWADSKRNMRVRIKSLCTTDSIDPTGAIAIESITYSDGTHPMVIVDSNDIKFLGQYKGSYTWKKITCDSGWKGSTTTYTVRVALDCPNDGEAYDDGDTIGLLKLGFNLAKLYLDKTNTWGNDWNTIKTLTHTDGFQMCSAPSEFTAFSVMNEQAQIPGKTFETQVIQLPLAEIIGKFTGDVQYQLRYVKTLNPIILDDLSNYGEDFTIEGLQSPTECELPEETHQEIVERAVTLAKIAWQGGTVTQAASRDKE